VSVENSQPEMNTTPNINMPSYSQQAMRRVRGGAVRRGSKVGEGVEVVMNRAGDGWRDCRIAANLAEKSWKTGESL